MGARFLVIVLLDILTARGGGSRYVDCGHAAAAGPILPRKRRPPVLSSASDLTRVAQTNDRFWPNLA